MSGERLAVVLLTAHRLDYARATLKALCVNLQHDGPVRWHIADDGDDAAYVGTLLDVVGYLRPDDAVSSSRTPGGSYGANCNAATQVVHAVADYILPVEDDWVLARSLDTAPILKMLALGGHQSREEWAWAVPPPADFEARSVRLGYLGYQWPLTGHMFKTDEHLWMALDHDSPEQHVAAGHPRIETVAYQRAVGPWNEATNPGMTELDWCQRPEARRGVVWPLTIVSLTGSVSGDLFGHIGAVRSY